MILKEKLEALIPEQRERVRRLLQDGGDQQVGTATVSQIYGGMRGIKSLVTDISYVDPVEGIRLRGYTIPELIQVLPKAPGAEIPMVGGLYYLLLIGEVPTYEQALEVEDEWRKRREVPPYVFDVLRAMPDNSRPMTLFSMAILSMQHGSVFTQRYDEGMRKEEYWEPMLEDCLNLTARAPIITAFIYHMKREGKNFVLPSNHKDQDWAGNFAYLMGVDDPDYRELSRLYAIIHSDHETGNASAHATHLVASTLSDIYYAASASMNALAGPLHGKANQEALHWLMEVVEKYNGVPTREELKNFAWETLNSGQVIPGYGHAVLRKTDPRYTALLEFGKVHFKEDEVFDLAKLVYEVVPDVLREQGKAKDPWPNVDAISGTLQYHYGVWDCSPAQAECGFYTVLFGLSRLLGVTAHTVWARALYQPIERPKSLTTSMLEELIKQKKPAS